MPTLVWLKMRSMWLECAWKNNWSNQSIDHTTQRKVQQERAAGDTSGAAVDVTELQWSAPSGWISKSFKSNQHLIPPKTIHQTYSYWWIIMNDNTSQEQYACALFSMSLLDFLAVVCGSLVSVSGWPWQRPFCGTTGCAEVIVWRRVFWEQDVYIRAPLDTVTLETCYHD